MLVDVGMVKMYSKSAHVKSDLGFVWTALLLVAWTNQPHSLHGSALLLVPMVFTPGGFSIYYVLVIYQLYDLYIVIYKSATSRKGGVISDLFAEQRVAWANVNWFLAK